MAKFRAKSLSTRLQMEWVFADLGDDIKQYSEQTLSRHIQPALCALGRPVEFKKISTDIDGLTATVVPKGDNKLFDLVVKFNKLPHNLVLGKVTLETSLDTMPKVEVPLHISAVP